MKPTNPPALALGERAAASTAASAGRADIYQQQLEVFGANAKAAAETPCEALEESSVRSMSAASSPERCADCGHYMMAGREGHKCTKNASDSSPERCEDCGHYLMAGREGHKCTARPEVKRAKTEAKESKAEAKR